MRFPSGHCDSARDAGGGNLIGTMNTTPVARSPRPSLLVVTNCVQVIRTGIRPALRPISRDAILLVNNQYWAVSARFVNAPAVP